MHLAGESALYIRRVRCCCTIHSSSTYHTYDMSLVLKYTPSPHSSPAAVVYYSSPPSTRRSVDRYLGGGCTGVEAYGMIHRLREAHGSRTSTNCCTTIQHRLGLGSAVLIGDACGAYTRGTRYTTSTSIISILIVQYLIYTYVPGTRYEYVPLVFEVKLLFARGCEVVCVGK